MADVRSLLRSELASRGQQKSKGRPAKPSAPPAPAPVSKKRKATNDGEEERKRAKSVPMNGFLPEGFFEGDADAAPAVAEPEAERASPAPAVDTPVDSAPKPSEVPIPPPSSLDNQPMATAEIDEDEWAAFERDVATPPPERPAVAAYSAAAIIQAAPMSAEEIAAQAREGLNEQRGRREAELEAEKEDAARHLEEEFDEMEALETRARRLRERREQLRRGSVTAPEVAEVAELAPNPNPLIEESEEDDDNEEEDVDDWAFGAR